MRADHNASHKLRRRIAFGRQTGAILQSGRQDVLNEPSNSPALTTSLTCLRSAVVPTLFGLAEPFGDGAKIPRTRRWETVPFARPKTARVGELRENGYKLTLDLTWVGGAGEANNRLRA